MVVRGDWLTPHWNFQLWFEKPPLLMWTMAAGFRFFEVSEFWSRVPSALAGFGLVLLTQAIARRCYGARAGILSALVLLSTFTFLFLARHGMTDVPLCFFSWLAVYAYLRVREGHPRGWVLAWASVALAFLVKGAAAVVAPAAIAASLALEREWRATLKTRHFWWGSLLAACIVLPWPALMWARYGAEFASEFFGYHVVARVLSPLEGHRVENLYYLKAILSGAFPWVLLFPLALLFGIRESRRKNWAYSILFLLPAVVLALYLPARTKAYWYLLPIYPACAILTAALIDRACQARERFRRGILLAGGGVFCLVLFTLLPRGFVPAAEQFLRWRPLYETAESPVAKLARLAAGATLPDRQPLILCSDEGVLPMSAALFYSGRPVQQAFAFKEPLTRSNKRYFNPVRLSDLVSSEARPAIISKRLLPALAAEFEVSPVAEAGPFVYASIKRR